jgi:hypothetical protein
MDRFPHELAQQEPKPLRDLVRPLSQGEKRRRVADSSDVAMGDPENRFCDRAEGVLKCVRLTVSHRVELLSTGW